MRGASRGLAALLGAAALAGSALVPGTVRAQATHLVVVTGLGGTPEYGATFHGWATGILDAATGSLGIPAERTTYLAPDPEEHPERVDGRSTREGLEATLERVGSEAGPQDRILLVLLGHGTRRGEEARFNLPGPDVGGADLAALLDAAFPTQTVAVVNAAPASAPFIPALSGPRRVVLTATSSAREQNETRFGGLFARALQGEEADLDKDGRLSLLEVFRFTRAEVERAYQEENLLLTEHALLDDDGDGEGSGDPGEPGEAGDGALAGSFWLGGAGAAATSASAEIPDDASPELRRLLEERAELEQQVAGLRARRGEMEAEAYDRRLEELLLELALLGREIREAGGADDGGAP